jgi:hypothetical protein
MKKQKSLQGIDVIVVGAQSIREVFSRISGCEQCSETVVSVEGVLDDILAKPNGVATYILGESLVCPACQAPLIENTMVGLNESAADYDSSLKCLAPALAATDIVLIDEDTLLVAQSLVAACEHCEHCDNRAEISFDYLLDAVTGCDPSRTE